MTAPAELFHAPDQARTQRVEVDVADQFQEVAVGIHQYGLISALEQMPRPLRFVVHPAGVAEGDILHDLGERDVRYLDGEMDVVGHAAQSVDAVAVALHPLLDQ